MKLLKTNVFNSSCEIVFDPSISMDSIGDLVDELELFELQFSRFNENSELSRFNNGELSLNKTSCEFKNLLSLYEIWEQYTHGVISPWIGQVLNKSGYGGCINSDGDRKLLDFSGLGKSYCIKRLCESLQGYGKPYLVNLGGDVYSYQMTKAEIDLLEPISNRAINTLHISNGAIASSGTKRISSKRDKLVSHIVIPEDSKLLETNILLCTTFDEDIITADAMAKYCLIEGENFCRTISNTQWPNLGIHLLFSDDRVWFNEAFKNAVSPERPSID